MANAAPRTSKTDYVVKLWSHLQGRVSGIMQQNVTFQDLTSFMGDSTNIKLTANFFMMLSSFCNKTPIQKDTAASNTKKARLILSALMIMQFPNDVLDVADIKDLDPSSEACYKSANNMMQCILNNNAQNIHKLQCEELLKYVNKFENAFANWKSKDLEKVLQSIVNYYTQWMRSYKVLAKTSMNEAHKKMVLNILNKNMNNTEARISKLVGAHKATQICKQIKDSVNAEPEHGFTQKPQHNQVQHVENEEKEEKKETLEEKLAAKGVPMNIKSGRDLLRGIGNKNDTNEIAIDSESKYIKMVNGEKMVDLDQIVMEESSNKYWMDFRSQIENNDFSRLFELLCELLKRLKALSPDKEHKHLDDLMDVDFIQQTIENGMIDAKGFYGIFNGIWNQIKSLHAPSEDKMWQLWHDHIVKQFGSDDATWGTLLSEVFNVFLRKMDKIEDQIMVIQHLKNKNN